MIDYGKFPGLAGVYLEDSYVLAIAESADRLSFRLDAVLTPDSPAYHAPRPGEQYCYAMASLVFPHVKGIEWLARADRHYTDATGEEDLGNIDTLEVTDDLFVAEGDWGRVRIRGSQPYVELEG